MERTKPSWIRYDLRSKPPPERGKDSKTGNKYRIYFKEKASVGSISLK